MQEIPEFMRIKSLNIKSFYKRREDFKFCLTFIIDEATAHDRRQRVEDTLVKRGKFMLAGKKTLLKATEIEDILVDVRESPIERPKKKKKTGIQGKRKNTQ